MPAETAPYEYQTIAVAPMRKPFLGGRSLLDRRLNEFAAKGWEIASTAGASRGFFLFGIGELTPMQIVLLRRARAAAPFDRT